MGEKIWTRISQIQDGGGHHFEKLFLKIPFFKWWLPLYIHTQGDFWAIFGPFLVISQKNVHLRVGPQICNQ